MSVPKSLVAPSKPFDYLICVNRWPTRKRFELYPCRLRDRLPTIKIPLTEPDPDVPIDIQAAFEQVYEEGGYMLRVLYDQPCVPRSFPRTKSGRTNNGRPIAVLTLSSSLKRTVLRRVVVKAEFLDSGNTKRDSSELGMASPELLTVLLRRCIALRRCSDISSSSPRWRAKS